MADNVPTDPIELTRALIRCASVTPTDGGALALTGAALERLGFTNHYMTFSEDGTPDVSNLYARLGDCGPNFCFAGHTEDHGCFWGRGKADPYARRADIAGIGQAADMVIGTGGAGFRRGLLLPRP